MAVSEGENADELRQFFLLFRGKLKSSVDFDRRRKRPLHEDHVVRETFLETKPGVKFPGCLRSS